MPGAFFCSKCGNTLIKPAEVSSVQDETLIIDQGESVRIPPFPTPPPHAVDSKVALLILNSGISIHLPVKNEITLGRATEGQMIIPDIDLRPYNAYEAGVSRLHANLIISDSEVFIHDLGSANGTSLNGAKIDPHMNYSLKHGDRFSLGKLKIQVLLKHE